MRHMIGPRIFTAALAAGMFTVMQGCQSPPSPGSHSASHAAPRQAQVNHLVFFKLKDHALAGELIADCDRELGALPMVMSYFCGRPFDTGRGDRVDSDYDVGFYVGFAGEAEYAAYLAHPNHQALVAKWQPRWDWIRVQDVLDESP